MIRIQDFKSRLIYKSRLCQPGCQVSVEDKTDIDLDELVRRASTLNSAMLISVPTSFCLSGLWPKIQATFAAGGY